MSSQVPHLLAYWPLWGVDGVRGVSIL